MKYLFFFLLFSMFTANAQEHRTEITGTVKDVAGNPVAFVNVGIMGKSLGDVSDRAGKFRLLVSDSLMNDCLTVSHIAYKKYSRYLRELVGSPVSVVLEDSLLVLPEVNISPLKGKWISNKGMRIPGGVIKILGGLNGQV